MLYNMYITYKLKHIQIENTQTEIIFFAEKPTKRKNIQHLY